MRYIGSDDFGPPETAFLICRFWLNDALWMIGRRGKARDLSVEALRHGLWSEDVHPRTGALWGNFPQTNFMAGPKAAIKRSRTWENRYWRGSS